MVSDLVGYPIDFYINIDLDGFVELVDAVGGVDFNVPIDMEYEDFTQDLYISFEAGMRHLDGQAAMEVCRFPEEQRRHQVSFGGTSSAARRCAT